MVIYRLPYAEKAIRIDCNEVTRLHSLDDLRGRKGFVMVPASSYTREIEHPILLFQGEQKVVSISYSSQSNSSSHSLSNSLATGEERHIYTQAFSCFISALKSGSFSKLVLSRMTEIEWKSNETSLLEAFYRACAMYPRMMIYLAFVRGEGAWMGCTPEILISGSQNHYRTMALAGTMQVAESVPVKEIVWSEKNRREQEIVADYIRESVKPYARIIEEEGPYTSRAGQLVHLKTEFHLSLLNSNDSILTLVDALHPTPAVCGLPAREAAEFIRANEGYDRSYYSGIVGMLDTEGETNLYVNLRCAHAINDKLSLYAGGGILKDSNLESEWAETNWKMNTILSVL